MNGEGYKPRSRSGEKSLSGTSFWQEKAGGKRKGQRIGRFREFASVLRKTIRRFTLSVCEAAMRAGPCYFGQGGNYKRSMGP